MNRTCLWDGQPADVLVLKGSSVIIAHSLLLEDVAAKMRQFGAFNLLSYFLQSRQARCKFPFLVLLVPPGTNADELSADKIFAAGMFYEYRVLGVRTRAFLTADIFGIRSIVAPPGYRDRFLAIAVDALMECGAHLVLASYDRTALDVDRAGPLLRQKNVLWVERSRPIRKQMPLKRTLDETLATFGKKTRFNLRYYRRKMNEITECEYVADCRGLLHVEELVVMNATSVHGVAERECRDRYKAVSTLRGGFMTGLRTSDGEWISVIGGWRQGPVTYLQWQVNVSGYEKYSISTVMRSYFLENECARGTETLFIYNGTQHSMQNSFDDERVWDLIVRRKTARVLLVRAAARPVTLYLKKLQRTNFLAKALLSDDLQWHSNDAGEVVAPAGNPSQPMQATAETVRPASAEKKDLAEKQAV